MNKIKFTYKTNNKSPLIVLKDSKEKHNKDKSTYKL